ncbi:alpha/beta fold hydrolase, partial [Cryobacterium roopkundense]|uniref:Pimeloyl-ACP methyl ester carboxylesterase n=1 Tax=Cryobacterium roopkundense TaxID=1001240 RepID=A0A7W9E482_9MICO
MAEQYSPFALETDARYFGLTTSSMRLGVGTVSVRHGRRTGSDTATILLHGAAGSWTTWTPLISAADARSAPESTQRAALPTLTDLIIPDLPGWGDSPLPADAARLTIETMADTVADVARALGYRRWIVIGHSMGGLIALQLAAAESRETVSVGLVSATTFSVIQSVRHPLAGFGLLPGYTSLLQVMRLLRVTGTAGRAFVAGLARVSLLRPLVAPLFRHPARIHRSVIDALGHEVRPAGFSIASERAGTYDAAGAWARIRCPVRASHGDWDVFVAPSDALLLHEVLADFSIATIPDTGHFGHIERPYDVLQALAV